MRAFFGAVFALNFGGNRVYKIERILNANFLKFFTGSDASGWPF